MTDMTASSPRPSPVRVGLIGAGRMGSFHGETLARRIPDAQLIVVADPAPGAAERLASVLGARATTDTTDLLDDSEVDAVVIASAAAFHTDLVVGAAAAGKAVFCEKPMALTLADADRAIEAARSAGVPLQVGFNRRFAPDFRAARDVVAAGGVGTPQLMRSITRDRGIVTDTVRRDADLFRDAYTGELAAFVEAVRTGATPQVTGEDARGALAIALACIASVKTGRPVHIDEVEKQ